MVHYATTLIGAAALLARFASALPSPQDGLGDSALGREVAVSAPDGIPLTDTAELARQLSSEAAARSSALPYANAPPVYVVTSAAPVYEVTTAAPVYETPAVYSSSQVVYPPVVETSVVHPTPVTTEAPVHVTSSVVVHPPATTTIQYGSGSAPWNNDQYNNCVQQCVAQFGNPMGQYTPPPPSPVAGGNGVTHTVIVAPSQGVLRYVPFAVNATVGDTIKFMWNANVHTVTKSNALALCNTTAEAPFASGRQNKSFVFTQVVNTTDPVFFHCAVPNHCQRGMFGIINPPSNVASANSVSQQMQQLIASNPELAAMFSYTGQVTASNTAARTWGGSIDMTGMPDWAMPLVAENVMYSRTFLAANPEVINDEGKVDLGAAGDRPLMIPQDLSVALAANGPASSASTPSATGASPAATTTAGTAAGQTNSARSMASSSMLAGVVALMTALYAL